ncbi:MAG: DUF4397 domain-containing protein [Sphingobacteriaceae bacterium]|nr:DUF4397 domain-containing protein [Sphingobacteriaceae bacterium]
MKTYTHTTLRKITAAFVAILGLTLFLSSCERDDPEMEGTASIRVIHSAQATGSVDLFADDVKLNNSAIAYSQSSTYFETKAGERTIQTRLAGSTQVVSTQSVNLEPGKQYTIYVTGTGGAGAGTVVTTDDNSSPSSSQGKVRFINLSTLTSTASLVLDNSTTLFTNVAYGSTSDLAAVAPGSHTFKVTSAANANVSATTTVNIQAGKIYTVYLTGTTVLGINAVANN